MLHTHLHLHTLTHTHALLAFLSLLLQKGKNTHTYTLTHHTHTPHPRCILSFYLEISYFLHFKQHARNAVKTFCALFLSLSDTHTHTHTRTHTCMHIHTARMLIIAMKIVFAKWPCRSHGYEEAITLINCMCLLLISAAARLLFSTQLVQPDTASNVNFEDKTWKKWSSEPFQRACMSKQAMTSCNGGAACTVCGCVCAKICKRQEILTLALRVLRNLKCQGRGTRIQTICTPWHT